MRGARTVLLFLPLALLLLQSRSFELQDTIHALIEENIHLHDQLENLTQALRELRRMLWQHSKDPDHNHHHDHHDHHDEDAQHLWDDWSEHGISPEAHVLLEHALCGHHPHSSAGPLHQGSPCVLLALPCVSLLLLSCW